ncbi:hypothetical protein [Motilimonas pumila]|uniref:Carboxypeptidase regulatory-like domain-containing protein n=1 Tax=Motilimonas pumila TaxID=2303987 RepID=A0A418YH66_9GAMM|nr:hypothetical protein [Motilimonas pumila]RJG49393.1 hypothetical protein D1Z90_05380 [Motilimonas pumila]
MLMFKKAPLYLALSAAIALVGCGGSGSSSDDSDGGSTSVEPTLAPVVTPSPAPVTTATEPRSVKGVINAPGLTDSSVFKISLVSLNAAGELVQQFEEQLQQTMGQVLFDSAIQLASDGGSLVVTASSDGYASYSKTFDFDAASDFNSELQVNLQQVNQVVVQKGNTIARSGLRQDTFSFAVHKMPSGRSIVVDGNGPVPRNSLMEEIRIDIPADSLPASTSALSGRIANYDPTDAEESEAFPGAYRDSDGNTLVSVAFSFAEIRDQDGQTLSGAIARAAEQGELVARNAAPTMITRTIPAGSCASLEQLQDANSDKAGFQIPVYTYNPNAGDWDLLGYGDVFNAADDSIVPDNQQVFDCPADNYYLEVVVSNDDFLRDWWNLDYPLLFDTPVELCANVKLLNPSGNPVAGSYVFLSDPSGNRSFSDTYAVTDGQGSVALSTTLLNPDNTQRTASLRHWGYQSGTYLASDIQLSEQESCGEVQVITVQKPDMCSVSGTVTRAAGGSTDENSGWLYAFPTNTEGYMNFGFTQAQANGQYSMDVECDIDYQFYTFSDFYQGINAEQEAQAKTFNVNGTVSGFETSDDGDKAILQDAEIQNLAPLAILTGHIMPQGQSMSFLLMDFDFDYPVSYRLEFTDMNGAVVASVEGTAANEIDYDSEDMGAAPFTLPTDLPLGSYSVSGILTDATGNQGSASGIIGVTE